MSYIKLFTPILGYIIVLTKTAGQQPGSGHLLRSRYETVLYFRRASRHFRLDSNSLPAGYRVILKNVGSHVRPISPRFREVAAVIRLAGS